MFKRPAGRYDEERRLHPSCAMSAPRTRGSLPLQTRVIDIAGQ
jgi:hypothetical protein